MTAATTAIFTKTVKSALSKKANWTMIMKTQPILDDVFKNWYDANVLENKARTREMMWLAFQQGVKFAARDAIDLMDDYACATAGLPAEFRKTEDMYDIVSEDLRRHFDYLIKDSNE
jgi:hypothetical protein